MHDISFFLCTPLKMTRVESKKLLVDPIRNIFIAKMFVGNKSLVECMQVLNIVILKDSPCKKNILSNCFKTLTSFVLLLGDFCVGELFEQFEASFLRNFYFFDIYFYR